MNTSKFNTDPSKSETDMKTQERDPLGLAALPELQPPQDGWLVISAQLHQQRRRRQQWLSGMAIAATVTLVAGIVAVLPQLQTQPGELPAPAATQTAQLAPDQSAVEPPTDSPLEQSNNLLALQNLSQRLEQNLHYLRSGVGAMPAEMVVYQVELEDLVAQVDDAISQQPESGELWQQRVSLLMDLNQIYGAGLRRDEPFVASL